MARRVFAALALLTAAALLPAAAWAQSSPPQGASASSTYSPSSTTQSSNAFDGNTSTYWQGAYNANPNVSSPFDLTSWQLVWGYAQLEDVSQARVLYAADARFIATGASIQCSTDGATWTTLASVPVAQDSTVVASGTCQWVRLNMAAPGTGYTPAVAELTIIATPHAGGGVPASPDSPASIVAIGDSITAGAYSALGYPSLLPVFIAATITNKGVSGDTTAQMLARFQADVVSAAPAMALILGGTNDVQNGTPTATTMVNLEAMVSQAQAAHIEPVLVAPLPRSNVSHPQLVALRSGIVQWAAAHGVRYVDPWYVFQDPGNPGSMRANLTSDGVHPNARGAWRLDKCVADALGWSQPND